MSSDTLDTPVDAPVAPEVPAFAIDAKYIEDGKILGKYATTVELLEAMATGAAAPVATPAPTLDAPTPTADTSGVNGLQVPTPQETPETPGLAEADLARYEKEAIENGALSEASLVELEARGYPRAMATTHVQGLMAMRDQATAKVSAAVGGTEVVQAALAWAGQNKTAAEVAAINGALSSADPTAQALIIKGLVRESGAITGSVAGSNAPILTSAPYPSEAQWLADISNPKYKADPAFRQQVMARTQATEASGGYSA